jgi:hypothetical protein
MSYTKTMEGGGEEAVDGYRRSILERLFQRPFFSQPGV